MLKIKLARFGKKKQPVYRIVLAEARSKRDGKYLESIGYYAPTQNPKVLKVDLKAYDEWISKGAKPTDTVASLVHRFRNNIPFVKKKKLSKKAKEKLKQQQEQKQSQSEKPQEVKENKQ